MKPRKIFIYMTIMRDIRVILSAIKDRAIFYTNNKARMWAVEIDGGYRYLPI